MIQQQIEPLAKRIPYIGPVISTVGLAIHRLQDDLFLLRIS